MYTYFLCLLSVVFPEAPQRLSGDILQWLCAWPLLWAVKLHFCECKHMADGIFLLVMFDQCEAQKNLILLLRWGRCFYQKRQAKKKKKTMRAADGLSHPDILFSASILFVKRQALYLCSYPENKQAWRHSEISSREYHSRLPVTPKCSVCGLF